MLLVGWLVRYEGTVLANMATLDESPCAKNIREALATTATRCSANLVNSKSVSDIRSNLL